MKNVLIHWIWCQPQTFIGFIFKLFLKKYTVDTNLKTVPIIFHGKRWSLSLGSYLFVTDSSKERIVNHEYGHYLQNLKLGPLYLLVVGLPSICWYWLSRKNSYIKKTYFERFPENWADKLGKVKRI